MMFKTKDLQDQQAIARRQAAQAAAQAEALERQIEAAKAAELAEAAKVKEAQQAAAAAEATRLEAALRGQLWGVWETVQQYGTAATTATGMSSGKAAQMRKLTLQLMALAGYDMQAGMGGQLPVKP